MGYVLEDGTPVDPSQVAQPEDGVTWGDATYQVAKDLGEGIFQAPAGLVGLGLDGLNSLRYELMGRINPNPFGATSYLTNKAKGLFDALAGSSEDRVTGPVERYSKAILQSVAVPTGAATSRLAALGNAVSGVGAQGASDLFPESPIAPMIGALTTSLRPSNITNALSEARQASATLAAQDIAKSLLSDPKAAITSLRTALSDQASTPLIVKSQKTYLPQYQRTAEIISQPGTSALEKAIQNNSMEAKIAIPLQDAAREDARQAIMGKINPNPVSSSVAGDTIRKGLSENAKVISEKVSELSEKAFKGGENLKTYPAKKAVSTTLKLFTEDGSRTINPEFKNLIDNFRALPRTVDLKVLQNYRSSFGEWAASGGGTASTIDKQTAKIAGSLRQALDDTIEKAVLNGELPKSQANAWRKMRDIRTEQGTLYERNATGEILKPAPFSSAENPQFVLKSSDIPKRVISSPEDAKQVINALRGKTASISAVRSSLLSKILKDSTNATTGEFVANSFNRQVRTLRDVSAEILTPSQIKALETIGADLRSQTKVARQAFAGSKGNSITAESLSMNNMLTNIKKVAGDVASNEVRKTVLKIPVLGSTIDAIRNTFADPLRRQNLINQELAKFVMNPAHAEALLSHNISIATPALLEFGRQLKATLARSSAGAISNTSGNAKQINANILAAREASND